MQNNLDARCPTDLEPEKEKATFLLLFRQLNFKKLPDCVFSKDQFSIMTFTDGSYKKDHGLAWLVCFAGFLMHAIGDGLGMCFGVLVPYIQEYFDNSRYIHFRKVTYLGTKYDCDGLFPLS